METFREAPPGFLVPGQAVPFQDQNGDLVDGKILEVGEEVVKVDFNHPLAGVNLHFSGTIEGVRAATDEELEHGHVHGPGGHQH
jgi:FKBP-type peptidyl-prolyl cis-trans isomerase SlyD